jgi:hypothetical protein
MKNRFPLTILRPACICPVLNSEVEIADEWFYTNKAGFIKLLFIFIEFQLWQNQVHPKKIW